MSATYQLSDLRALESEAIHIVREVAAEFERPVMLFSGGKDSIVMLHLALKAFAPAKVPFPIMHVDTGHNFDEVIAYRDRRVVDDGLRLVVASVQDQIDAGVVVEEKGPRASRNGLQTSALLAAIEEHRFDALFGGARRDEEKARAKERVYSFRDEFGQWDPKGQRPELWSLYNGRHAMGEHFRIFPISNWTELDIWQYIYRENIPIPTLYFAAERPIVERDGALLMVDDERMPLAKGEKPKLEMVRFRTLGCYPLTGAVRSNATTLPEVIQEMLVSTSSERQGRVIDHDQSASMEKKKQEGYF